MAIESVVRYRYRVYPDAGQRTALSQAFGCARVVYNDLLEARETAWAAKTPQPTFTEMCRNLVTLAPKTPERSYLAGVSKVVLQQALRQADQAYRNYFTSLNGTRAGMKMAKPKFRSRHDSRQGIAFTRNAFRLRDNGDLMLVRIGELKVRWSRDLPSFPTSVSIIRESDGRYYASFVVEVRDEAAPPTTAVCGIDVGLSTFATVLSKTDPDADESTLTEVASPKFLRAKARALARSHRSMSRKQKGSASREKARVRNASLHRKVRESRLDHAHQVASLIVAEHQIIAVEGLSSADMARGGPKGAKGRGNRKSVHDAALGQFLRILAEKSARQGRQFVAVDQWFPSTRTCSNCDQLSGPRGFGGMRIRNWVCARCGASHDRDANAAQNILTEGLRILALRSAAGREDFHHVVEGHSKTQNACGGSGRPGIQAAPVEAGTAITKQHVAAS